MLLFRTQEICFLDLFVNFSQFGCAEWTYQIFAVGISFFDDSHYNVKRLVHTFIFFFFSMGCISLLPLLFQSSSVDRSESILLLSLGVEILKLGQSHTVDVGLEVRQFLAQIILHLYLFRKANLGLTLNCWYRLAFLRLWDCLY